jgi:hypothetical protein
MTALAHNKQDEYGKNYKQTYVHNPTDDTERENIVNIADDIFRVISYKEAAVLVSSAIHDKSGIKCGYLPSNGKKDSAENFVVLRSSDRALEIYDQVCQNNGIKKLDTPLSTQIIRKLHLLAFGDEFSKKARQRDGDYLSYSVRLQSPIRSYKALYKTTTHNVPIEFEEISSEVEIDEKHEEKKISLPPDLDLVADGDKFLYPKYKITLEGKNIGTVFKCIYYVCDKNLRVRKKSSLWADVLINIDGRTVKLNSPNKKVLTNIREWLMNKLSNCLKDKLKPVIEYKSDNRGVVFAAMPLITKLAQMNDLLSRSPAGRDSELVNWIDREDVDNDGLPYFPNRDFLSSLIIH